VIPDRETEMLFFSKRFSKLIIKIEKLAGNINIDGIASVAPVPFQ
jgi:hypothetical protein